MFIFIVYWLGRDKPSGILFCFVPTSLLSTLTYFIFAVQMRERLGKHSCMCSSFPIPILNGTCFFPIVQQEVHNVYTERKSRNTWTLVTLNL